MENAVGPILRMSDEVDVIVAAIRDDNPDAAIEVIDRGAYVRVQAPNYLRITRETLAHRLGRDDFEMRELEGMLASFAGRIRTSTDDVVWELLGDDAALARKAG